MLLLCCTSITGQMSRQMLPLHLHFLICFSNRSKRQVLCHPHFTEEKTEAQSVLKNWPMVTWLLNVGSRIQIQDAQTPCCYPPLSLPLGSQPLDVSPDTGSWKPQTPEGVLRVGGVSSCCPLLLRGLRQGLCAISTGRAPPRTLR